MNAEQLQKFCSVQKHRVGTLDPFSQGAFTYATDCILMVRVDRLPDVSEVGLSPNVKGSKVFDVIPAGEFFDIPPFEQPEAVKCKNCKGTGKVTECAECGGTGEVEYETDFNEYVWTCKSCQGKGELSGGGEFAEDCDDCEGTGTVEGNVSVQIGCSLFGSKYLARLQTLPGVQICPTSEMAAAYFKFDGGDGFIMPRSK